MGVPSFYRWLAEVISVCVTLLTLDLQRFPKAVKDLEAGEAEAHRCHNLYLDMNGIIHPACHPEGRPAAKDEQQMMREIERLTDEVIGIARPSRLVYLVPSHCCHCVLISLQAVDGVAPRAKMNQQRSRRFKAHAERKERLEEAGRLKEDWVRRGLDPPEFEPGWDSNQITPGL